MILDILNTRKFMREADVRISDIKYDDCTLVIVMLINCYFMLIDAYFQNINIMLTLIRLGFLKIVFPDGGRGGGINLIPHHL